MGATDRKQVPWEHSAMTARFFFTQPRAAANQQDELALWNSVKENPDPAEVRSYLRRFPQGSFAVVAQTLIDALETQRRLSEAALVEQQRHETALRKAEDDVLKAQEAAKQPQGKQRVASLPTEPSQDGSEVSFDGRWEVTRVGAQCAKGASVTFSLDIKGTDVSGGSGAITSAGSFKYQRASGALAGLCTLPEPFAGEPVRARFTPMEAPAKGHSLRSGSERPTATLARTLSQA